MKWKITALLFAGTITAITAGGVSFLYLSAAASEVKETRDALASYGEISEVPVLISDMPNGHQILPEHVKTHRIPTIYLTEGSVKEFPQIADGVSLIATKDLKAGELLFASDLGVRSETDEEESVAIIRRLDGQQTLAVNFRNFGQMANMLDAGRTIDVFWTSEKSATRETRLLVTGSSIAAVPENGSDSREVALNLTPEQTALILQASGDGFFSLALSAGPRAVDAGTVQVSATELRDLPIAVRSGGFQAMSDQSVTFTSPNAVAQEQTFLSAGQGQKTCTTALIRAGQRVTVEVPC